MALVQRELEEAREENQSLQSQLEGLRVSTGTCTCTCTHVHAYIARYLTCQGFIHILNWGGNSRVWCGLGARPTENALRLILRHSGGSYSHSKVISSAYCWCYVLLLKWL